MSKKIDRLRREYPRLTVSERVQLLLAAQERGDRWEIDALDRTCLGSDLPSYITHVAALERAASLLVVQLLAHAVLLATCYDPPAPGIPSGPPLDPDAALLFRRQAALW
jgi:hypothetical protein